MKIAWRWLLGWILDEQRRIGYLEAILIIFAIAIPILIYMVKFGWPKLMGYY